MKFFLIVLLYFFMVYDSKAQNDTEKHPQYKSLTKALVKDYYYGNSLFVLQFFDTLSNSIEKNSFRKNYTCSSFLMPYQEKMYFLRKIDNYYFKIENNLELGTKIFNNFRLWYHIYESLQIENITPNVNHLSILLSSNIPNKYIPQTDNFIKYRSLAKKIGIDECLLDLVNKDTTRFDLLMQMTTYIYHLSASERFTFFEIYFREAQKINAKKNLINPKKDTTTASNFHFLKNFMVDKMHSSDMLMSIKVFDTLSNTIVTTPNSNNITSFYFDAFWSSESHLEKEKIMVKLDNYLSKQNLTQAERIVKDLSIWGAIYHHIEIERFQGLSYLYIVLGALPSQYVPKDSESIVYYRNNVKKLGLKNQINSLDDENALTLLMLIEMTNFVYYLSDKDKLKFFEEYYKQAKIYSISKGK